MNLDWNWIKIISGKQIVLVEDLLCSYLVKKLQLSITLSVTTIAILHFIR